MSSMPSSTTHTEPQHEKDHLQQDKTPRIPTKLRFMDPSFLHNSLNVRRRSVARKKDRTVSHPTGQRNIAVLRPVRSSRSKSFPESAVGQSRAHLFSKAEVDALVRDDSFESAVFITPHPSPIPLPLPACDAPSDGPSDGPSSIAIGADNVPMENVLHTLPYAVQSVPNHWPCNESAYASFATAFAPSYSSTSQQYLVQGSHGYEEEWFESPTHSNHILTAQDLSYPVSHLFRDQDLEVPTISRPTPEQPYFHSQTEFNQPGSSVFDPEGQVALSDFEPSVGMYPEPWSQYPADDLAMLYQSNDTGYFTEPSNVDSRAIMSQNAPINDNPEDLYFGYQNQLYPQSGGGSSFAN